MATQVIEAEAFAKPHEAARAGHADLRVDKHVAATRAAAALLDRAVRLGIEVRLDGTHVVLLIPDTEEAREQARFLTSATFVNALVAVLISGSASTAAWMLGVRARAPGPVRPPWVRRADA